MQSSSKMQKKLLAIIIAGITSNKEVKIFTRYYQLSDYGFFQKGSIKDAFKFIVRQSLPSLSKGTRNSIEHQSNFVHTYVTKDMLAGYAFCSKQYPRRIAFSLINKSLNAFRQNQRQKWKQLTTDENIHIPQIAKLFQDFKDTTKIDKVQQATKITEQTQQILEHNLKKLLQMQGDLQQLVDKSKDLNQSAKLFLKNSQKMNKCCMLI